MDFGGMYGSAGPLPGHPFYNPITHGQYCPAGYTAYKVLGTASVDWPLYWCGRPHMAGRAADFDFGGTYSDASSPDGGAVPWKDHYAYVNPFTSTASCPPGYAPALELGTANRDHLLFFCYRRHAETGPAMDFAGFSGGGSQPYPNPMTGEYGTCPTGYTRYITYGTPDLDFNLYYCGAPRNAVHVAAGAGSLGLGDEIVANTLNHGYSLQAQIDGIISLHPRVFRLWMDSWTMFTRISGDGRPTPNAGNMALFHHAVDALTDAGITVIGMDSRFPSWLTGGPPDPKKTYLPCRDLSPGKPYRAFLDRWEAIWAATAREFPSIKQWEIGNETNTNLPTPFNDRPGACGKTEFTAQDRLLITLDLMYYGNRGVKSVDPDAVVYMSSISPHNAAKKLDVTLTSVAVFLEQMYTAIASGKKADLPSTNPRDYFDGANWHPYVQPENDPSFVVTYDSWVKANERPYQVLRAHGDGGIPVIFSEAGYMKTTSDSARDNMDRSIDLAQRHLPWLTYLIWFRAYATPQDHNYALLEYQLMRTKSAPVFCKYTGCDNLPYKRF
jgi:hypothetical protein